MKRVLAGFLVASAIGVAPLSAQNVAMKEESPGLLKKAKITPDAATATAMTKVPGGKLESSEIEIEDKKLLYVFTIKVAGKSGVEEISVDALTGAFVSAEHESPEDEAAETKADNAKADKAKAAAKTKPPVRN